MSTSRGPAYRIRTERLLARPWAAPDAPRLRESLDTSDQHLRPWIPFMKGEPCSLAETLAKVREHRAKFEAGETFRYALFTPDEADFVGECMLFPRVGPGGLEIGYWIDVRHAGRGFATEVTAALVRIAFEVHGVDRAEIHCTDENKPSAAIPAKLGFEHEATLKRRAESSEGDMDDLMIWTLFASSFSDSPAAGARIEAFDALGEPLVGA